MNCFKLSLGLSLLILLFLVHNKYYISNVFLCSIVIVLLLNQVIYYEKFQSSVDANSLLNLANYDSIGTEQKMQDNKILHLENMLRLVKAKAQERQVEDESTGGILIENSCNVETEPQDEDVPKANMNVMRGLNVNGAQFGSI